MLKLEVIKLIGVSDERSAWKHGVKEYARELMDGINDAELRECAELGKNGGWEQLTACLLNGAKDWREYSWGGCSLVYDGDIAERLCNPTELKRTRHGERRPNAREEWLDTQARALGQAARRVWCALQYAFKNR